MRKNIKKLYRSFCGRTQQHAHHSFLDSYTFISKERDFFSGDEAKKRIEDKNDKNFFVAGVGVPSVDQGRWQEAQGFEKRTWMQDARDAREDGNSAYIPHFDAYGHVAGKRFLKAIELGCGPFTNIRHIARYADIDEIHLLDPLIGSYMEHPNCTYQHGLLQIKKGWRNEKKRAVMHESSIENFKTDEKFNLVVMINVIEHCFDLAYVFEKIISILHSGGYFIFYDKYFLPEEIHEYIEKKYDAGHPLRVAGQVFDKFLRENFQTLLYKQNLFSLVKRGFEIEYTGLYFIGRKK